METLSSKQTLRTISLSLHELKRLKLKSINNISLQLEVYELKFKCSKKIVETLKKCLLEVSSVRLFITKSNHVLKQYHKILKEIEIDLMSLITVPITLITINFKEIAASRQRIIFESLQKPDYLKKVENHKTIFIGATIGNLIPVKYLAFLRKVDLSELHQVLTSLNILSKQRVFKVISSIIHIKNINISIYGISSEILTMLFLTKYGKKYGKDIKLKLASQWDEKKYYFTSQAHIRHAAKALLALILRVEAEYEGKENILNALLCVLNGRTYERKNDETKLSEVLIK